MTENQARQPQGIPVGGQFAATTHAEPDVCLTAGPVVTNINIEQTIELKRYPFDELPPLPESVGTPDVGYSFEAGKVETSVTVNGEVVTFWTTDLDGTASTLDSGVYDDSDAWGDLEDEDREALVEWATAVHERIDSATYGVMLEATLKPDVEKLIVAHATGRETQTRVEPPEPTPAQESAKRTEKALAIWDEGDGGETAMQDALTDLRHYADRHGIDIYKLLDRSYEHYLQEKNDPAFREGF